MSKNRSLVNLSVNLPDIIISLVKTSFRNLGNDIADVLLLSEVNIKRNSMDKKEIITNMSINNQIADNIDKILLQHCGELVTNLHKKAFKVLATKLPQNDNYFDPNDDLTKI